VKILSLCDYPIAWIVGKISPPAYSATCIIKGTFSLRRNGKAEPVEEHDPLSGDLFVEDDMERSYIYESDFACFKPRTDLFLYGKCHPLGNQPAQGCRVTFQVGEQKKSLYIFGNRFWQQNAAGVWGISDPTPFTEMALIYENSYGGAGFANNPVGKGFSRTINEAGKEYWPLPNIENPERLLVSPDQHPDPVGFGPLGRMWPLRTTGKIGTYDDRWLQERWPYFPSDFDWGYFNGAPPDMQMNGYLLGDEPLYFENLHPQYPHYHAQLPCLRTRLFINEIVGDAARFREVKLKLDTLWVDMEAEKLNLIWRGVIEVASEEMQEIQHCLVVSESMDNAPEPLEYYQFLLLQRLQEEQEEDKEEPPVEIIPFDDSWVKEMEADFSRMEEDFKKIEAQAAETEKSTKAILVAAGIDPAELKRAQKSIANMPFKDILTQAAKQEQQIRELSPELAKKMPPPMTPKEIDEIDQSFQFEPWTEIDSFPEPLTREDCEKRIDIKMSFENEDLTDLDLTNLNFSGCNCCNTTFSGASLQGATFTAANLSGANLAGCDLSNLNFQGANLGGADLTGTILTAAILSSTVLDDTDFSTASLENAIFDQAHGFRTIFVAANLKAARFIGADLQEADFETANLETANFTHANLKEASVESANGRGIIFQSANLTGLHASAGPDFTGGNFKGALAAESIWEDATLEGADFSAAYLVNADFTKASLKKARFSGADLTKARFEEADLTETSMMYVNLFQGSLEKAKLVKTDLQGTNLYEVEFYLAEISGAKFEGSNLKMTKFANKG
jgi:uncharacterized protein YjbI with pentapeptide repeats